MRLVIPRALRAMCNNTGSDMKSGCSTSLGYCLHRANHRILFKYGFLQPIGKYRGTYEGEVLDVLLYTITPDRKRLAVAEIRRLLVPKLSELSTAVGLMRRNGWLRDMEDDLSRLGIPPTKLSAPPDHIVNVRFKESEVTFFDPRMRRSTGTARCPPRTSRSPTTSSSFSARSQRHTRPEGSARHRTVCPPPRLRTFLAECRLLTGVVP